MQTTETHISHGPTQALATVPSCSLDDAQLTQQLGRYARLAPAVEEIRKEGETLLVRLSRGFERDVLAELIAVERECCPFFEFGFDETQRRLRVSVPDTEHAPALNAIAAGLGATTARRRVRASRRIGRAGTVARVAGALAAIGGPIALHGITWWDVVTALVALPLVALAASAAVDAVRGTWIRNSLAVALVIVPAAVVTFVSPVDGTAIWSFLGLTLLVAAYRGDAGCEVVAIPNALAARRDPTGCVVFAPIDALERRRRRREAPAPDGRS
jgi:hypothetical protein